LRMRRYRVGHPVSSSVVHLDSSRANGVTQVVDRGVANWVGGQMNKWLDHGMWGCVDNRMCWRVICLDVG